MRAAAIAIIAIGLLGTGAAAEEIGIASVVKPKVHAFPPGKDGYDLMQKNPIERGTKVKLEGRDAFLRVDFTRAFGCNQSKTLDGRRISGVLTILGPSDADLGSPTRCEPKVRFSLGRFFLALLHGEPLINVDTPEAVAGVKGTVARFLVPPLVGTFVAVDEGVVSVQAKAGGDPVEVEAGQWVVIPPGGLPTRPASTKSLDDLNILGDPPFQLRDFTTQPPRPPQ
ncbi:MAG TPA: hypothetical protein VGQ28_02700 [Thermoanaerobaculia bacterium]|nr:hypothetical protein [Thermoanaerobaculia bacterium]